MYPSECPVFEVTADHPWEAWHGDHVQAVSLFGLNHRVSVWGPWSGIIPTRGLRPLTNAAKEMMLR